ncbi:phosphatidylglycerophosphatase A [candidate division KSB1 bacterium]|nr:phosphatidylglycerophosphatase A [candidate division KSB1 bacterium]
MKKTTALFIATTFYSGYFPIAPGTVGSFVAIVALWLLPPLSWLSLSIISIVGFIIGVWASNIAEEHWGHDPGRVNWDEVVGMIITIIALPKNWIIYVCAFFVFRLFDVVKPYPVNKTEKLPAGLGIMSDDVVAGIFANVVLQIVFRFIVKLPFTF